MLKISNKTFVLVATLCYAVVVSVSSYFHVVWRDEVVPMTQVMQSSSLSDLSLKIHNFGHPILWYFLLYMAHQVIHSYWALKLVNILICVGAIAIFLVYAPFSRLQKILFISGVFPLYWYSVFNRNYGISMLLLFAFASLYPKRFEKMIFLGCILFLLANAHTYSLITTIAILSALVAEFLFCPQSRQVWVAHLNQTIVGFTLIIAGIIFSINQITPDQNNITYSPHPFSMGEIVSSFVHSIFFPGESFSSVMGVPNAFFTTLVVFFIYIYLISKPYLFIFFSFTVIGLGIFYHLVFHADDMRYQGALYLLIITIFWIESYAPDLHPGKAIKGFRDSVARHKDSFFIFLLILQVCMSYLVLTNEFNSVCSSSKSFGEMLKQSTQFKDAILIGEPATMLEAVPYYADNAIYLPREGKFKKYIESSTDQKLRYSLAELLATAKVLRAQTGKRVLIVMGYKLPTKGSFIIKETHNRVFFCSQRSLDDFFAQTRRIAVFDKAITSENYSVYLLK